VARRKTFYELLTEAINHFVDVGYTSETELQKWVVLLKKSADKTLRSPTLTSEEIRRALRSVYSRVVINGGKRQANISKFTLDKLKPTMRRDLERRILASANLIKLNREEAISNTLRRFQGWATSVPKGGSRVVDKRKEKENIRKPLTQMGFKERRVIIDQTHKFAASLNDVIATNSDAIAAEWNSRYRRIGYDYRPDHKERDSRLTGKIYAIRNNWAIKKGLMKASKAGYTDEMTMPGEEVFCSCTYTYIYALSSLPEEMLTTKGRALVASRKG